MLLKRKTRKTFLTTKKLQLIINGIISCLKQKQLETKIRLHTADENK